MTTWVLLRGLTRECRHWGEFPAMLGQALPDARIVPVDLPGNGRLNRLTSPMRVEAFADAVRDELARQRVAPPYHVLAMSLGAMVAVAWAAAHPDEVDGTVLINTSLRPFSPMFRRLRPANYPLLLRLACDRDADRRERTILQLTSGRPAAVEPVLASWAAIRHERPVSGVNALRQLVAAARYRAPPATPPVPVLLLAGRRDQLVSPSCSRDLARRWHCALAEHPDAGHDLPLDDPGWVARQIRAWVDVRSQPLDVASG